ncbi:MAG TPA: cytochrome c peroxidase [Magnetospirillum sp.]|nr:cytochrome c peroxidase [Magnetospirillum sp.]
MNANLSPILAVGLLVVLFATSALVLLVRGDLAANAGRTGVLSGGGQIFLGAALGIGVIAFSLKLAIILALSSFPDQTIAPLLSDPSTKIRPDAAWEAPLPPPFSWQTLPARAPDPIGNPTTSAKVALGARLFHDTALSWDRTVSCASCHDVTGAGTDGLATAIGITRVAGKRNAPTVWNAAFQAKLFWDGRARSLEEQAGGPPLTPDEMGMPSATAIEQRVAAEPGYAAHFAQAFGDGAITMEHITQAIAAYERTLIAADSPYDRFVTGDAKSLSEQQQRGMALFKAVGCVMCHSGPNFSGASLVGAKNPYAPLLASRSDIARSHGLGVEKGRAAPDAKDGVWRIPSLRNVALTAPYFHNGSVTDLAEAVRVMATAQLGATLSDDPVLAAHRPQWSAEIGGLVIDGPLVLASADVADLVAFLRSLSSDTLLRRVERR